MKRLPRRNIYVKTLIITVKDVLRATDPSTTETVRDLRAKDVPRATDPSTTETVRDLRVTEDLRATDLSLIEMEEDLRATDPSLTERAEDLRAASREIPAQVLLQQLPQCPESLQMTEEKIRQRTIRTLIPQRMAASSRIVVIRKEIQEETRISLLRTMKKHLQ